MVRRRPPSPAVVLLLSLAALLLSFAILLLLPGAARAAAPAVTAQAQEADAAFLAYAPPPPGGAGALCLVDTGVHPNPDTSPGLLSATAIDGGSGDDVAPDGHGTVMAMIAGGAGKGVLGVWPQLKIVSVRATNVPTPGQEPTFEFQDYAEGMAQCVQAPPADHVRAIELALSSTIPGSPDEVQGFASRLSQAHGQNIAVVAAAGNQPGPVEEPAAEPGVFTVGAATAKPDSISMTAPGTPCGFTANQGLTLYAPGCGLDQANPFTDTYDPNALGNGTSQASAFAAAVIVAMTSYDPALGYAKAEQLLAATAKDGNLDVAAAFQADGLGAVVAAGSAAIPRPVLPRPLVPTAPAPAPGTPAAGVPGPAVKLASWRRGVLRVYLAELPAGARLHVELTFAHRGPRYLATSHRVLIRAHVGRPRLILLRLSQGRASGATVTVRA